MDKNENTQYYVYKTDLRELFLALWKRKKMIIGFSLAVALLIALFTNFIIKPVYDTKLNIIISMPDKYMTRFGEYELPVKENNQFLNLIKSNDVIINTIKDMGYVNEVSVEDMQNRITIVQGKAASGVNDTIFEVAVSANNREESLKLAKILYENYLNFIDVMTKEGAIIHYNNYYILQNKILANELNSIKEILNRNEALLNEIPKILVSEGGSIEVQQKLNESSDYVVPINNINPNYISLENDILRNKQSINEIENHIRLNNFYLTELSEELKHVKNYYEGDKSGKIESNIFSSMTKNIYLPSQPVLPTYKSSPSLALNTAIGAVVGLFAGVMTALVKEYWLDKSKN